MRILTFNKGAAVPEWVASMNSKWFHIVFRYDVRIVKEGPWCTICVERIADEMSIERVFQIKK